MALKQCPICGEKYSDTYNSCPFCEELEDGKKGKSTRRNIRQNRGRDDHSWLSSVLLIAILILLGILVYLLFGDTIAKKMGFGEPVSITTGDVSSSTSGSASEEEPPVPDSGVSSSIVTEPSIGTDSDASTDDRTNQTKPATDVTVKKDDFTLNVGDIYQIRASGGTEEYEWEVEDSSIATVNKVGVVTAQSQGATEVTVSDGFTEAVCIVRVTGTKDGSTAATQETTSTGGIELNKDDVTAHVGDVFTLTVNGTSSTVTWTTENSNIAKVDGGKVTAIGSGTTNVKAAVNGKTLNCIVRVK